MRHLWVSGVLLVGCTTQPMDQDCSDYLCDEFIEPDEATYLYVLRPEISFQVVRPVGDSFERVDSSEADALADKYLTDYRAYDLKGMLSADLTDNFETVASGPASERPAEATHVLRIVVSGTAEVEPSLLPEIQPKRIEVAVSLELSRAEGGAAPMQGVVSERYLTAAFDGANKQLVDTLYQLPVYHWRGLGHMGRLWWGSVDGSAGLTSMQNQAGLFGEGRATFSVQHSRVVDEFLGLIGGDYEFDPVYLALSFDEPTELRRLDFTVNPGAGDAYIDVLVSNLDDPETPSSTSSEWAKIATRRAYDENVYFWDFHMDHEPERRESDFSLRRDKEFKFRHIALVWKPATLDSVDHWDFQIDTFNVYLPPEKIWHGWTPPSQ